ncbi:TDT family transporter [Streptantibioticus silvisoli]|uniref:TDT family transporter n=1 Tax=Streptantibioticus silvisoli TaxID=2705255 RepID=A0ABT6W881_9ACTN|nr:TDT family transporter [Streptantibioticus silvisoli]MDI5966953.1 TDT family transporter [Streptantibioticus silvisoli]
MTTAAVPGSPTPPGTPAPPGNRTLPRAAEPERGRPSLRHLGPNWYAAVMGTAVVATGGAALPAGRSWLPGAGVAVWALSVLMLVVLTAARAGHWAVHHDRAREQLLDPAVAPFYGCVPMALLAVGAATAAVGGRVVGAHAAVVADAVLWSAGTAGGLAVAVGVPYLMITRHEVAPGSAAPAWLLPIVPPMVSAATGPALVAHLPAGQAREAMLYGCCAMFGMSLLATLTILPLVFSRLVHGGPLPLAATPTLLLVLGPLGQSVTATGKLADAAPGVVPAAEAHAMGAFAVLYGLPVTGFALLWLALSLALLAGAARRGMPFAMTWWAFTFPLGTCVTGTASLAAHTGLHAAGRLAEALYVLLVAAWATAAVRTGRGLLSGALLAGPRRAPRAPR